MSRLKSTWKGGKMRAGPCDCCGTHGARESVSYGDSVFLDALCHQCAERARKGSEAKRARRAVL
jgi:hypothetical protein